MRTFLITLLTIWTCNCYAQTGKVKFFKKTEYRYVYGELYEQVVDTVKTKNEPVDIYFFNRHFNLPYYLPEKFTDKRYAGQTISDSNPNAGDNFQSNWVNTYSYDSIGRVTNFSYSSCLACSSFPYSYSVTYNARGQVATISNKLGSEDRSVYSYSLKGELIKFAKYSSGLLETEITLIR